MLPSRLCRSAGSALLATIAVGVALVASDASALTATSAAVPARTVPGSLITRPPGTLAQGSKVRAASLGIRTFADAKHGFALADVGQAQYPAASVDGGKTWRTNGPALHLDAAQGPLAVVSLGAANRRTIYAYGGGSVIDATGDAGKHWYRALFGGVTMAVTPSFSGHLIGFIDGTPSGSAKAQTWQYVSKNRGRSWQLNPAIGGA